MSDLTKLEAHYGVAFPPGYRDWSLKKYTDYRDNQEGYLWVHEAEWIPPDEIPERDLWRLNIIPGLIPFAFNGAGDNWCWNTQVKLGDAEYEVLFCWHDEDLADAFAPTFPAWFYRNCLDFASGTMDNDEDEIQEARENLRLWSDRLSEIHPGPWAEHLLSLAEREPFEYKHPKLRASVTLFGFITAMEVDQIVAEQFGIRYLEGKVEWGTWPN
jgi:hypothetical protein